MKGLIAPLLALMMTGMVFSQQPQSSRFGAGDAEASGSAPLLGRFLLEMMPGEIQLLKTHGQLSAPIDRVDQDTIDHVDFLYGKKEDQRPGKLPLPITQTGSIDGNGKLEFMFTDSLIESMRRSGLRYVIPDNDRGKYDSVVVTYQSDRPFPAANPRSNSENTFRGSDNNNFSNNQDFSATTNNRREYGPYLPEDMATRQRLYRDENFDSEYRQRQVADVTPRRENRYEIEMERQSQLDRERRLESERRQEQERRWQAEKRLEAERNNRNARNRFADSDDRQFQTSRDDGFDLERRGVTNRGQERLLAERRMENRMAEQRMAERRRTDQNIDDRENEGLDYKKRQLALENAELRRELEDERDIRNRTQRELARERRFSDSIERERLLDDEERMRHDDRDWVNNRQRYANRRDDDFGDRIVVGEVPPNDQYVNTTTTRNNASPQPSGRLPTFSINGPNNDRNMPTVENRTEWALWFIMLASVGLNFYLSWIARGFYIRYEELADEIRDTFTNTM